MQSFLTVLAVAAATTTTAVQAQANNATLLTDLNQISRLWGQVSNYADNPATLFGVRDVGLPQGCQIEQAHQLQRHAQRFPTSSAEDGTNDQRFASKLDNYTKANPGARSQFTGPLSFLPTYRYIMGQAWLTGLGASTEFGLGVDFFNKYGRILYNASATQLAYNATYSNGTVRPKLVIRTTDQSRIENSAINWALGFFGPSWSQVPNPTLANWTAPFSLVIIPEGGKENNTLASYDACFNSDAAGIGTLGDLNLYSYIPRFLGPATQRIAQYAPAGLNLTTNDTYAMMSICAYETQYIGSSSFCGLFTADEWAGFEYTLDLLYYYDYTWGNPTGRAQGIGYVQELLARLQRQYVTAGNTSTNVTLDNNPTTFPLNQSVYVDLTHDDIITSVLAALSIDYFHANLSLTQYPPAANRSFILSQLTPFGGHLTTEVIGCAAANPPAAATAQTQYYPGQYGYDASNATNKFVRLRVNNGILPLNTIVGGACSNGRTDGLCSLNSFLQSQKQAEAKANFQYACYGNYTINNTANPGKDYDGTISK